MKSKALKSIKYQIAKNSYLQSEFDTWMKILTKPHIKKSAYALDCGGSVGVSLIAASELSLFDQAFLIEPTNLSLHKKRFKLNSWDLESLGITALEENFSCSHNSLITDSSLIIKTFNGDVSWEDLVGGTVLTQKTLISSTASFDSHLLTLPHISLNSANRLPNHNSYRIFRF